MTNREADNRPALWKARRQAAHDRLTRERIELVAQYHRKQADRLERRTAVRGVVRAAFWIAVATGGVLAVSICNIG